MDEIKENVFHVHIEIKDWLELQLMRLLHARVSLMIQQTWQITVELSMLVRERSSQINVSLDTGYQPIKTPLLAWNPEYN